MQDTMPKKRPYSEAFWSGCGKMRENIVTYLQCLTHADPYHIETSTRISRSNQWTGFYITKTSIMKELIAFNSHNKKMHSIAYCPF